MGCTGKTVSKYVLFSGDPWRVNVVKEHLEHVEEAAFLREFNTCTGVYKGLRVTVTSTGIGAPSAAIAMEEMYECGMKVALRMGTAMALRDDMLGHFIVPIGSMRRESTSKTYVEESYPAVADLDLVNTINGVVADYGKKSFNGISCTMDGFYTQMHDSLFSKNRNINITSVFDNLRALGVSGIDMESSCMLTVGRLMGVKTAVVTAVTVLENLKKSLAGQERIDTEVLLCQVALESMLRYANREK
ncbi:MAG: nucleoside phosphorylase [Treponema sp.]|nr:nucleoside phosphorylase [Treponema sp.]